MLLKFLEHWRTRPVIRWLTKLGMGIGSIFGLCVILALAAFVRCQLRWPPIRDPSVPLDDRPLLAFGGSFFLHPFCAGVTAYVVDNFDVDQLRVSGLSGGAFPLATFAFGLNPVQSVELFRHLFMELARQYDGSNLFMEFDKVTDQGFKEMRLYGITDETLAAAADREAYFVGISELSWVRVWGIPIFPYLEPVVLRLPYFSFFSFHDV